MAILWPQISFERQFHFEQPNPAWVGDITYIPTDEGWLYLAMVKDLCICATTPPEHRLEVIFLSILKSFITLLPRILL